MQSSNLTLFLAAAAQRKSDEKINQKQKVPVASFLKERSRLRGKLAPTQWWHLAELAPTCELGPTLVLKNWPQGSPTSPCNIEKRNNYINLIPF
jgi:hypothetical protein